MRPRAGNRILDVAVLGAGNVGMALALLLLRQELGVQLIDRRRPGSWIAPTGFDSRVYALNAASRALLASVGAWQRLNPARLGTIQAMEVHGDRGSRLNFRGEGEALAHVVEDGALQHALAATLDEVAGPDWWREGSPARVEERDTGALTLQLEGGATLQSRLLVGADGAQSWLREAQGWPRHTREYQQLGVVVNLYCSRPHDQVARQWFLDGEVIALLPLGGSNVSLVWSADAARARALTEGPSGSCSAALRTRIGEPLGTLEEISPVRSFPLRLQRVPVIAGHRSVLVGDAAHGVHPLAGQGLNLGLEDVACLSEVLATRGAGPDVGDFGVLRRHARRRAGPVARMQWVTDGLHRLFALDDPLVARLRNHGLDFVDRAPSLKSLLAAAAAGSSRG